jgi:putative membrane-bound dehydrogenase-like protein
VAPALVACCLACAPETTQTATTAPGATGPEARLGEYRLHPELALELAAAEPLVFDPVDLEFDERGRAFVLEMPGFPFIPEGSEPPGRIVELVDRDADGRFDERRVFADRFRYADSILPLRGGLLVADAPELLFVKDTDGDGAADLRQVLLVGFGEGPSESNFNGLRYGPDNWVHGANGSSGGSVHRPGRPDQATSIRGRDFRIRLAPVAGDPHRLEAVAFETTSRMGGGFGLDFDDWGRRFVTHEQRHVQVEVFPARYLTGLHPWPSTVVEISDHGTGDTARVFPISKTEERPNHPEQAGYFTAGCGLTHYGGGALPARFHGAFFVAEAVHNLVHVDLVEPAGASFVARRERPREEVLAFADNAVRPDNFAVGPEGALYVLDIHRGVIEHPEWIPDEIEATLDLRAGEDQGRVLRLVPPGGLPPVAPRFDRDDPASALEGLGHRNKWWRDTAQRLLVEWGGDAAVASLRELARGAHDPKARVHALWTLEGLGALDGDLALAAISDPHPRVREQALRLAEPFLAQPAILERVLDALPDPDLRVALQGALSLGLALGDDRVPRAEDGAAGAASGDAATRERIGAALIELAPRAVDEPWLSLALQAAIARSPGELAPALVGALATSVSGAGRLTLVEQVAAIVGDRGDPVEHVMLLRAAEQPASRELRRAVLHGLATGAARSAPAIPGAPSSTMSSTMSSTRSSTPADTPPSAAAAELRRLLGAQVSSDRELADAWRVAGSLGLRLDDRTLERARSARDRAVDPGSSVEDRLAALELVELVEGLEPAAASQRLDLLLGLLDPGVPAALQGAAIEQLGRADQRLVGPRLVAAWASLGPAVRRRAGDLLLYRRENHEALLEALERGVIGVGELALDLERRRTLLRGSTPEIGARAARLFGDAGVDTRPEVYTSLLPALQLEGEAARGSRHFDELCARCHRLGNVGTEVGPNLTDVFRKSAESLLHDVVDPNAAVGAEHVGYIVTLAGGEVLTGLVSDEADGIRVRSGAPGEDPVGRWVPRARVAELRSTGLSLMPEGLEAGLDPQDVADLVAFLQRSH